MLRVIIGDDYAVANIPITNRSCSAMIALSLHAAEKVPVCVHDAFSWHMPHLLVISYNIMSSLFPLVRIDNVPKQCVQLLYTNNLNS